MHRSRLRQIALAICLAPVIATAATPRPWKVFLLFGQSNMAGGAPAQAQDKILNPRVKVLAYGDCAAEGRTHDQWYTASPSLHLCNSGMGLGDAFGRILADSLPLDTIALIPCAIPGVDIDFFRKGVVSSRRKEFSIPPDNHWTGAYPWMLGRLKQAQQKGEIAGILFHQGESDWQADSQKIWPGKVEGILKDLKTDLGFGDVPFLAGELRQDGCCSAHNRFVATLAKEAPNGHVVSSTGLQSSSTDVYHFTNVGYREFGRRYAVAMLDALSKSTGTGSRTETTRNGWTTVRGPTGNVLEFDAAQDRIELRSPSGAIRYRGAGSRVELPRGEGVLILQASNPKGRATGIVSPAR